MAELDVSGMGKFNYPNRDGLVKSTANIFEQVTEVYQKL